MGEVYLAIDLETTNRVALKVLRWHDDAAEARFAREAAVLAELSHPGIVRYVAHGATPVGEPFLAMEWIDGELLNDRLRDGPLSIADSLAVAARVAEALSVAHGHHIIHRDVKPANLICEAGDLARIKILDFGLERARRGLACAAAAIPPPVDELGRLRATLAEAYTYLGDNAEAEADGLAALDLLPAHGVAWLRTAEQVVLASARLGHVDRLLAIAQAILACQIEKGSEAVWMQAASLAVQRLIYAEKRFDLVDATLRRMERIVEAGGESDPALPANLMMASAYRSSSQGDLGACLAYLAAAAATFEQLGDLRRACVMRHDMGFACTQLGAWDRAERELRRCLEDARPLGMTMMIATAGCNLGVVLARRGALEEAEALERRAIVELAARGDRRLEAGARQYLAQVLLLAGRAVEAEEEARRAVDLRPGGSVEIEVIAVLAQIELALGRTADALGHAQAAFEKLESEEGRGTEPDSEAIIRLAHAEALHASGATDAARVAIAVARDRILDLAEPISDRELRRSFLEHLPQTARILALAKRWTA
jgi:tetratricopeptide (TPR) repeat protein